MRLRTKLAALAVTAGVAITATAAYAAWTASGEGSGTAEAKTAVALTTEAASNGSDLYPGATVALNIKIKNDNPYPVLVTDVVQSLDGDESPNPILSGDSGCDASNGVSFTDQHGLTLAIDASSSASFSLSASVHMSNDSADACQGQTFTVPVSLSGRSAAAS